MHQRIGPNCIMRQSPALPLHHGIGPCPLPICRTYIYWQRTVGFRLKGLHVSNVVAVEMLHDNAIKFNSRLLRLISLLTGGPLHQGDIEEYKGKSCLMCPWHGYMFDLKTGENPDIPIHVNISLCITFRRWGKISGIISLFN